MRKPKIVFVSEAIRRDNHAPLKLFNRFEIVHFYLKVDFKMSEDDLRGARRVALTDLYKKIVAEKPDIIQGAEPFGSRLAFYLAIVCKKAAKKTGAKLIIPVFENRPIKERFNFIQRAALRIFCPTYFKRATMIALNSGASRNIKYYFARARIIEGLVWGVWGVDLDFFHPSAKKIHGQIVYVGRLVEEKGLKYLVEGFAASAAKLPYLKLNLVGKGDFEGDLRQMVKNLKIEKKVRFVGPVENTQLPQYFCEAELSIYPSITTKRWEEQVGTVNLQALSCGTPVLTTKSGAIPEYITDGEGAIIVDEKDSAAIAQAILKFYKDGKLRAKLSSEAREKASKYDIKKEVEKAQSILEQLLDEE